MDSIKIKKIEKIIKFPPKKISAGQYVFLKEKKKQVDSIQSLFKKIPGLYKFLIYFLSPVFLFNGLKVKHLLKKIPVDENIIIDLGSGPIKLDKNVIQIDKAVFSNIDIVADVSRLPLKDRSVDGVICQSLLEHVSDPDKILSEIKRVLRPKGYLLVVVPFLEGYHPAPEDYRRWTKKGVIDLLQDFKIIDYKPVGGPCSALVWIMHENLAIFFSFGVDRLYQILRLLFMVILSPIKYFDFVFSRYSKSHYITTGHSVLVQKK